MDLDIYDMARGSRKPRHRFGPEAASRAGLPPKPGPSAAGHRQTASSHTNGAQTAREVKARMSRKTSRTLSYDVAGGSSARLAGLKLAKQTAQARDTRFLSRSP
jgi:hypothetical protein